MEKTITIKYDATVKASLKGGDKAATVSYITTVPYGPEPKVEGEERKTVSVITDTLPAEVVEPVTKALQGVLDWANKQESGFDDVMVKVNEAATVARRDVQPVAEPKKK